jgi:antitoxin VapB
MALNIKDGDTVRLAGEVAGLAGETKTRAIKIALEERRRRLAIGTSATVRGQLLRDLLEREIWPQIPADELGRPVTRAQREAILGYGPEGV